MNTAPVWRHAIRQWKFVRCITVNGLSRTVGDLCTTLVTMAMSRLSSCYCGWNAAWKLGIKFDLFPSVGVSLNDVCRMIVGRYIMLAEMVI